MKLKIEASLSYALAEPCDLLLQVEAAEYTNQHVESRTLEILSGEQLNRVSGEEQIGERIWLRSKNRFSCKYNSLVKVDRPTYELEALNQSALAEIPEDVVKYLMPSRYCIVEDFLHFTQTQFSNLTGGAAIVAMRNWIKTNFTYAIDESDCQTGATSSFNKRRGVCRDYAHVLVVMARAASIPARYVSAYAPDVKPQDFHALAEVYLDGAWYLVDPTGMSEPGNTVIIGVGRDAADVAFLTTYGFASFEHQSVRTIRVG